MQDLLGLGDEKKLRSVAGLAGGVGHQGAACGILVGGAIAIGLASSGADEDQNEAAARTCAKVRGYIRKFEEQSGGSLCREIIHTNFDDGWQLRKYFLVGSLRCMKLAKKSAAILTDIISDEGPAPDKQCYELNRRFSERDFHCAHYVLVRASEHLNVEPALPPHVLIPFNGGIGYSGSTCAALLGGCIAIGAKTGGDTSRNSTLRTLRRLALTLVRGTAVFNRLDLSPANDALMRCAELFRWFEDKFHFHQCRKITGIDFDDDAQVRDYFERDVVSKCVAMAEETAAKAAEMAG